MRNSKNNAKCEKRHYKKCVNNPAKMYSVLQRRYADILEADDQVKTFEINVPVEIDVEKGVYTTDFLIELTDGTKTVKECMFRKHLCQPKTVKLNSYLADINEQDDDMFFQLVNQLAEKEGVTEQLKAENQMLWVRKMNNIRNKVMEIVNTELIYA